MTQAEQFDVLILGSGTGRPAESAARATGWCRTASSLILRLPAWD